MTIDFRKFVENKDNQGSANFMDRINSGWEVGTPKYASYEPHHKRHNGGGWTYENMYSKKREDDLVDFFEKQKDNNVEVDCIWSKKDGLRLLRSASGIIEELKVPYEKNGKVVTVNDFDSLEIKDPTGKEVDFNDANDETDEFNYRNAILSWD